MDPVGVSLGAVSLLFQVFAGCIKAYQLISEASDFEKDYQFIRIRFKTEQYRLLDFASVAQLTESDETLIINASNRGILLQVLEQQSQMMTRFGRFDDRLQPLAKPLIRTVGPETLTAKETDDRAVHDSLASRFPHANVLLQKALDSVGRNGKYPTRLRWVIFDRSKVEELLSRLVASNNFLQELLTSHQLKLLRLRETQTGYQIIQLNNKFDELHEIVQACLIHIRPSTDRQTRALGGINNFGPSNETESALVNELVRLGQFKALATTINTHETTLTQSFRDSLQLADAAPTTTPLQLDPSSITLDTDLDSSEPPGPDSRVPGWYHPPSPSKQPRVRVWVEWKRMDPQHVYNASDGPDPATLRRFRALVALLREHDHTRPFRAPPCLGYYLHPPTADASSGLRYGLVFQAPQGADSHAPPRSLREVMGDVSQAPSLDVRLGLMRRLVQAVERLHSVNWLHKGLCGENVIFFQGVDGGEGLGEMYLTGFDYSRPDGAVSMSCNVPKTWADDLYRHPGAQGGPREGSARLGFRKRHDVYSLGVLLVEVALWKPVEEILGIKDRARVKVRDVIGVKGKLLGRENMGKVRFLVGEAVAAAIVACLTGLVAFGLQEGDAEEDGEVAARLQVMFNQVVVQPLLEVRV